MEGCKEGQTSGQDPPHLWEIGQVSLPLLSSGIGSRHWGQHYIVTDSEDIWHALTSFHMASACEVVNQDGDAYVLIIIDTENGGCRRDGLHTPPGPRPLSQCPQTPRDGLPTLQRVCCLSSWMMRLPAAALL